MKDILGKLNKNFENRVKLGIMSVLAVSDKVEYTTLKSTLQLTDGNLASHLSALEKMQYITVQKQFVGRKPNTTYSITEKGKDAFCSHLDALENFIRQNS